MKWFGIALVVIGIAMAMAGNSVAGFRLGGIGLASLLIAYVAGRDPDDVPPDESDYLHSGTSRESLSESSTSFDLPDFPAFLNRLPSFLSGGFNAKAISHIGSLARRMRHNEVRNLEYEILFQGQSTPLKIGLFKNDEEEITVYFHSLEKVTDRISAEMEAFFAERGR